MAGPPLRTDGPPCGHATGVACWAWTCACGRHEHHTDPMVRLRATLDHEAVHAERALATGQAPDVTIQQAHVPTRECAACRHAAAAQAPSRRPAAGAAAAGPRHPA